MSVTQGSMAKPVLLICGCRKYEEYLHAAIRRMTRPEWEVIGLLGGAETTTFDADTRILTVATPDTYERLPKKLHAAYSWITVNRPGIPGIFKTDEDLLFDMSALVTAIREYATTPYWGVTSSVCHAAPVHPGRIQQRFEDKTLTPVHQTAVYCFGAGYWLSATVLPRIVEAAADYDGSALEDVCTGYVMNRAGWQPKRIPVVWQEVPRAPNLLALGKNVSR
jgi:hypothetical protein